MAAILALDDPFARLRRHREAFLPGMQRYQALCQEVIQQQRVPATGRVRAKTAQLLCAQQLINDVYLALFT